MIDGSNVHLPTIYGETYFTFHYVLLMELLLLIGIVLLCQISDFAIGKYCFPIR